MQDDHVAHHDPELEPAYERDDTIDDMWEVFEKTLETIPPGHPLRAVAKSSFGAGAITMLTWVIGVINTEGSTAEEDIALILAMGNRTAEFTGTAIADGKARM